MRSVTIYTFSLSTCHEVMEPDVMILVVMLSLKPSFSLSSFTLKRLFSSSFLSAVRVVSSTYLRLSTFLQAILIPSCNSSSLIFHMMYSAQNLNKQGDNIHTLLTYSFPNFEPVHCSMSSSNCYFLIHIQVSQETGKVVWYSHLFQNFPVCCDPHSRRLSCSQWRRRCFSGIALLACSMLQWMLAIWSLISLLLYIKLVHQEFSVHILCWSLAWRILSIPLLACEVSTTAQ